MLSNSVMRRSFLAGMVLLGALACVPPPPPGAVVVVREPPRERVEVIVASPGPRYVWVRGFWRWERNDYVWVPGRWVIPERGFHKWVPGHWQHRRGGWFWVEGHWAR